MGFDAIEEAQQIVLSQPPGSDSDEPATQLALGNRNAFGFPLSDFLNEYVQCNPRRCYWGLGADPSVENTTESDISSGRQPYSTP